LSRNKSIDFCRVARHFNKFLQENTNIFFNKFKIFNLDFFYLDALDGYKLNNIIFTYKKTIYREVFIFVERINNYAYIVDKIIVRNNLFFCLCDSIIT